MIIIRFFNLIFSVTLCSVLIWTASQEQPLPRGKLPLLKERSQYLVFGFQKQRSRYSLRKIMWSSGSSFYYPSSFLLDKLLGEARKQEPSMLFVEGDNAKEEALFWAVWGSRGWREGSWKVIETADRYGTENSRVKRLLVGVQGCLSLLGLS